MRIVYIGLLTGFFISKSSQAQQFQAGVKAGGTLSFAAGYDAENSSFRGGAHGGLVARMGLGKRLKLQAEGLYSQRGDLSNQYGPSIGYRLEYIQVPMLAHYYWDDVFLEAGPYWSKLLRVKRNLDEGFDPGKQVFRPIDYGYAVGFGYQDPTGLAIGWRYTASITNLYRGIDFSGDNQQVRLRNNAVELYLAFLVGQHKTGPARK